MVSICTHSRVVDHRRPCGPSPRPTVEVLPGQLLHRPMVLCCVPTGPAACQLRHDCSPPFRAAHEVAPLPRHPSSSTRHGAAPASGACLPLLVVRQRLAAASPVPSSVLFWRCHPPAWLGPCRGPPWGHTVSPPSWCRRHALARLGPCRGPACGRAARAAQRPPFGDLAVVSSRRRCRTTAGEASHLQPYCPSRPRARCRPHAA